MATQVGEAVIKLSFDGKSVDASIQQVSDTVSKKSSVMTKALGGVKSGAIVAGKAISASIDDGHHRLFHIRYVLIVYTQIR